MQSILKLLIIFYHPFLTKSLKSVMHYIHADLNSDYPYVLCSIPSCV